MPNSVMGEMVHAAVVLRAPILTPVRPQDLIAWCHSQLAAYKCPTTVHVVEELPVTGSGKVLKNVLRATFGKSATVPAAITPGGSPAATASTAAAAVAAVAAVTAPDVATSADALLAATAATAEEAAVSAVAAGLGDHISSKHDAVKECGQNVSKELLEIVAAEFPEAQMIDTTDVGLLLDTAKCHLLAVYDWTAALTQVSTDIKYQQDPL